jgi:hypothetical protein
MDPDRPIDVQHHFGSAMASSVALDGWGYFFPLWYPALIFALAGVAVLRLGRRFTLRSAIIATAVVAGCWAWRWGCEHS